MGRKLTLNAETIARAKQAATTHWRDEPVWKAMGISQSSFYSFKARGEREKARLAQLEEADPDTDHEPLPDEAIFLEFLEALNDARATLLGGVEAATIKNALDSGHLGLRLLERLAPDEYGKPTRVELTGKDGGPIDVSGQELAKDLAAEVEDLIRKARGESDDE